jgi:hypothetical protein
MQRLKGAFTLVLALLICSLQPCVSVEHARRLQSGNSGNDKDNKGNSGKADDNKGNSGNSGNSNANSGNGNANSAAGSANSGNANANSGGGKPADAGNGNAGKGKPTFVSGRTEKVDVIPGGKGKDKAFKVAGSASKSLAASKSNGTKASARAAAAKGRNMGDDCRRLQMQMENAAKTQDNKGQIAKRIRLQAEFLLNCVGPPSDDVGSGDYGSGDPLTFDYNYTVLAAADVTGDVDTICSPGGSEDLLTKASNATGTATPPAVQLTCQAGSALLAFYYGFDNEADYNAAVKSLNTSMGTPQTAASQLGVSVDDVAVCYSSPEGASYYTLVDPTTSSGLSAGAIIGIIAGSCALILLLMVWCMCRRKKAGKYEAKNAGFDQA